MTREFEIHREVVLPASPDQVFEAVSTVAGNAAWLFPAEPGPDAATESDPPRRYFVRHEQGDWFNALEFVIEGRQGGTSLLRYAHSGIFVEDWENQYDAAAAHTDFYLHTLGQYLEHFPGRAATYVGQVPMGIAGPPASTAPDGFARLQRALGLPAEPRAGEAVRLVPKGLASAEQPIDGVLDYVTVNFIGVRTTDALYRFFGRNAFGSPVGMSIHSFEADLDAKATAERWQRWLDRTLA